MRRIVMIVASIAMPAVAREWEEVIEVGTMAMTTTKMEVMMMIMVGGICEVIDSGIKSVER